MYGNTALPGCEVGAEERHAGSIWRGYTEATWFKLVKVGGSGEEATPIPQGTIMIEDGTTGKFKAFATSDIISAVANLPGGRLGIIADTTAMTGTTTTVDGESQTVDATVLIGIQGQVDKAKLLVGETAFGNLEDAQKINLERQLEGWNFQLVEVTEG